MKTTLGVLMAGPAGKASQVLTELEPHDRIDLSATLDTWFIHAPFQSPAWNHYVLTVIHLRDIEGVKPATLRDPSMTHEFILAALNPERDPVELNIDSWSYLSPFNLVRQVSLPNDIAAKALISESVRRMMTGELWAEPPLSGQQEPWRSFLTSSALIANLGKTPP